MRNWAGNITYTATRVSRPSRMDELCALVAGARHIRAVGTGHSFNRVADARSELVRLDGLPPSIEIDGARRLVTVAAGVRYGQLAARLHAAGYALHNLASLPHISVAGACATGTHGSGWRNGNLTTAVARLRVVGPDGQVRTLDRGSVAWHAGAVGLGAFGIVTDLTLDLVPSFDVRQYVYEDLPRECLAEHWAEILGSAYSVSLFTDWRGPRINQVWLKRREDDPDWWRPERSFMGARLADGPRHPVPGADPDACTPQQGAPGPWHERLPHFRPEFTPSSGDELQSEYFVPRERLVEALDALDALRERIVPLLQIAEVRTVAADELWLSPAYRRDSAAIHFTWRNRGRAVADLLPLIEARLAPLSARPHWGKLFGLPPEAFDGLYERLPDVRRLLGVADPGGKFGNDFVDAHLARVRSGR